MAVVTFSVDGKETETEVFFCGLDEPEHYALVINSALAVTF